MIKRLVYIRLLLVLAPLSGCQTQKLDQKIPPICLPPKEKKTTIKTKEQLSLLISQKEKEHNIPRGLLLAIACVESNLHPYAVNLSKKAHFFESQEKMLNFITEASKIKKHNISVGCCQLHLRSHKNNFDSIEQMITPEANIEYSAVLLEKFYNRHRSWKTAIAKYHGGKKKHNAIYYKKIMKKYNAINNI